MLITAFSTGSSPRGRGTRDGASRVSYPENHGSSPRGRGTLLEPPLVPASSRIIPAWAGNTIMNSETGLNLGFGSSPRGRGTLSVSFASRPHRIGSSPRGRGTRVRMFRYYLKKFGSSPRGRGTHDKVHPFSDTACRIIPAWAGNTMPICGRIIPAWAGNTVPSAGLTSRPDHPRVGGEHRPHRCALSGTSPSGSSPRGRGTPLLQREAAVGYPDHPRVGGEHSIARVRRLLRQLGSSPRGRGTRACESFSGSPRWRGTWCTPYRIIPAWAGNTASRRWAGNWPTSWTGSSPRGRGTRSRHSPASSHWN